MGALSRALTLALSVGLVGCTLKTVPVVTEAPKGTAQVVTDTEPALVVSGAETPQADYGWLNLTIRWPEPVPGYQVALLPATTNAIAVWVKQGASTVAGPVVVSRSSGATTVSKSIRVEAASNLSVEVKAYRESTPDVATAVPIAQGTGTTSVVRSKVSPLAVTLAPLNVPTVTGFDSNLGKVGQTVTVTGTKFGSGDVPVQVTFNGVAATTVTRTSETSLTAVVPVGATTGNVVVKADGVESTSTSTFWVLSNLTITAPVPAWDDLTLGGSSRRMVRYGEDLQFAAEPTWALKSGETVGQYGTPPAYAWTSSNPAAGSIDEGGRFVAATSAATTSVAASFGTNLSNKYEVKVVGIDGVTLNKSALTLNALPETGEPDSGYLTSETLTATVQMSGPFDGRVEWSSSDPSRVTVSNGLVKTVAGASEGTVVITATSVDDPSKKATASVTVTVLGDLELEIE